MEVMQDFPLEGLHFYCDTFDITRPYPSPYPIDQYAAQPLCVCRVFACVRVCSQSY